MSAVAGIGIFSRSEGILLYLTLRSPYHGDFKSWFYLTALSRDFKPYVESELRKA